MAVNLLLCGKYKRIKGCFLHNSLPHIMRDKPKIITFLPHLFIVKPNISRYLENVINGLNWHLKHSKPVPKNLLGNINGFQILIKYIY